MNRQPRFAVILLTSLLSACMVGPDYEQPEMPEQSGWHVDLAYRDQEGGSLADSDWIDVFEDAQLQNLVAEALQNNPGMLIALQRIEEARAGSRIARSALFPTVDATSYGEREEESKLTNTDPETADEFFLGLSAAWELDLWGAKRRAGSAAYANYLASEYGAQAVRLSLVAEVSRRYFELQGVQARLEINQRTLVARQRSLDIAHKRFKGGLTSKLEVTQSQVNLASTQASIPKVEQNKLAVENQLVTLLGRTPQHITVETTPEEEQVPLHVTADLPADLLKRRPDVMQAEQKLIAASEAVGIATAALLPSIRLTGDVGYETTEFDDLLDSDGEFWIAEIDVVMPIFNAGARRAELGAAESRFNQARLGYQQTVLNALREVSDSLNQFYKSGEALRAELALEAASLEYLKLANLRYRNGVLSYLDVLDAQRSVFSAQLAVSTARELQLQSLVDLYKSLGGGWSSERTRIGDLRP